MKEEDRCPQCGTENHQLATLRAENERLKARDKTQGIEIARHKNRADDLASTLHDLAAGEGIAGRVADAVIDNTRLRRERDEALKWQKASNLNAAAADKQHTRAETAEAANADIWKAFTGLLNSDCLTDKGKQRLREFVAALEKGDG